MKQLPIGNDDFKSIREDGTYYYVDKSMLIADILGNNPKGAYLFTRPRRFGKSLNLSMLDAFFNIRYKDRNTWFEGLEISEHHE
ncbi:MAG: AAA family ATPase, partial [archaeon]|nr:AAA family ATPase [archaeon]